METFNAEPTKKMLRRLESFRARPYMDSNGKLTVGYGHNLAAMQIDEQVAEGLLEADLAEKLREIQSGEHADLFNSLDPVRQSVLVQMAFQLGYRGMSRFRKMIAALHDGDYERAGAEALDSGWAAQTPKRAVIMAGMLRTGEWPRPTGDPDADSATFLLGADFRVESV